MMRIVSVVALALSALFVTDAFAQPVIDGY